MEESSSEAKGKYIVSCNVGFDFIEISYSKQVSQSTRLRWDGGAVKNKAPLLGYCIWSDFSREMVMKQRRLH